MKPSKTHQFIGSLLVLWLFGCGKNETENVTNILAQEYYPLQIGKNWVYDVDSIIYDIQNDKSVKIDTSYAQVREVITDTIKDANNQTRYVIERSVRPRVSTAAWRISHVFSTMLTPEFVLRQEGGFKYIKLPAILKKDIRWNGNLFNDPSVKIDVEGELLEPFSKTWNFTLKAIAQPDKVGNNSFKEVCTVEAQIDPKILTEHRYTLEKYAKGVGLIFKEERILDTQKLDPSVAWAKKAEKGFIVVQRLVSF